jgi:phosphopantothenoylcysteine decarboxylase/phosphopantothenate--cysteine ligase
MKIVVTAGPTREHLDPVRFLSNPSTGKMGFAVAAEAAKRGHNVVLVSGPVSLKTPKGVRRIDVVSARQMCKEVLDAVGSPKDEGERVAVVSVAAVADWRPAVCASVKLKKHQMSSELKLVRNPDILKKLSSKIARNNGFLKLVGFAAETGKPVKEAARKCREKKLSFIVANDVTEPGAGFASETNKVSFVFPDAHIKDLPLMTKGKVAKFLINEVERLF